MDNTKFSPPKGMRDWLPKEVQIRQKLIRLIESHYQLYGFQPIDTPVMENLEVLQGKGGGENEKLMFNVLKRGQELGGVVETTLLRLFNKKINAEISDVEVIEPGTSNKTAVVQNIKNLFKYELKDSVADMGLRFDLTVPLARYFANHSNDLPKPFRCYHIGPVWRADRPQKGRFREFYQCDIDIIGGVSESYEVELLLATDRVLKALNIGEFKIRISDKSLLTAILRRIGTPVEKIPEVAITIDKLDKQSFDEVKNEIAGIGLDKENQEKIILFINSAKNGFLDLKDFKENKITELGNKIKSIQTGVRDVNPDANVIFDPLLVRGFDYYTGSVFEINVEDKAYSFSIGGGGRYDGLIEKLGGPKDTPAVGVSLGFERILYILMERDNVVDSFASKRIYIANKDQSEKDLLGLAELLRSKGLQVETCLEKKDFGKQMKTAQDGGLEFAIIDFQLGGDKFKVRKLSTRQDQEMTLEELLGTVQKE